MTTLPSPTTDIPRLLTRRAAAKYLSISVAMLDSLRLQGEIAPVQMPGRNGEAIRTPLYDRKDLDTAIDTWKSGGRVGG